MPSNLEGHRPLTELCFTRGQTDSFISQIFVEVGQCSSNYASWRNTMLAKQQ